MSVIERCWVCPECHWTEWYDGTATDAVICLEHLYDEREVRCVEYVPASQLAGAVEESTKAHAALGIALSLMTPEQRELWDAALVKLSDRDLGGQ